MRHILLTLLFSGGLLAAPAQEPRSERYRFPVRNVAGLYSANFGEMRPNHFHSGVDIKTDGVTGKPVVAAARRLRGAHCRLAGGYGRALYIAHPDGTTTVYGHLERLPHRHRILPALQTLRAGAQQRRFHLQAFVIPRPRGRHGRPVGQFGMSFGRISTSRCAAAPTSGHSTRWPRNCCPYGDRIAPRIMRLHYVEVDSLGDVPVHSRPRTFDVVRRSEGDYALRQTQPVAVGRRGYFIVECSDRKDEVYNTFGIYRLTEEVDGEVRYEYRMDGSSSATHATATP